MFHAHIQIQITRSPKLRNFLASVPQCLRARLDLQGTEKPKTSLQFSRNKIPSEGIECCKVCPDFYRDERGHLVALCQQTQFNNTQK